MYLRKNNQKITFLFSFCPLKIFSRGNFFDKINIKKLTKFALFHKFCQTVRKIASDAPIGLQILLYYLVNCSCAKLISEYRNYCPFARSRVQSGIKAL